MSEIIKKVLRRFKKLFPGAGEKLEKELIPLKSEEFLQPKVLRRKKRV